MTSNKVYDLRQKLASLKEFLQEFSEFKERLTEPINDGDKDKILSILEDYRKYLENSDNGLFDNRPEIKTSIKLLKDIKYIKNIKSEEFGKKLKKIYTNLQNSSFKKMDKLLNLCDIIKDKEEQIKSNLNILCSVDDKGKEKKINLMDFLEKYLDLKSKDIKWAEITREITLIDEKCSFTHNETILKNILNSIIENAYRHGFVGYECAKPTIHFNVIEEKERIVMKICNNGKPINTTTEDYRTNGVFNGATGNTGIGGFQISRWANQYGGDVMVGKSDKWNTVIHLFIKK